MKANGFEPKYDYYKTNDVIIVKIEVPGNFTLESSLQYSGQYTIIKINGKKEKDVNSEITNSFFNGREFGNFSLDIPVKQEDFVIKNEPPIFFSKDGIITLCYKIQKIIKGVTFTK